MARPVGGRPATRRTLGAAVLALTGTVMTLATYEGWAWLGETDAPCTGIFSDCMNQSLARAGRWAAAVIVVTWMGLAVVRVRRAWLVTAIGVLSHLFLVLLVAQFGSLHLAANLVAGALLWIVAGFTIGHEHQRDSGLNGASQEC